MSTFDMYATRSRTAPPDGMGAELRGRAGVELQAPFPFDGVIAWSSAAANGPTWRGSLQVDGNADGAALRHQLTAPLRIAARGDIDLRAEQPAVELSGDWQELGWPPNGSAALASRAGRFTVKGPVNDPVNVLSLVKL